MSYRKVVPLFNISTCTLQNWQKNTEIKPTKEVKPKKIDDDALLKDVEDHLMITCMSEQDALVALTWAFIKC